MKSPEYLIGVNWNMNSFLEEKKRRKTMNELRPTDKKLSQ